MALKFALLGHPVRHSLSPLLHGAAFSFCGLDATYEVIDTQEEELASRLMQLFEQGYSGCNITIPHKKAVLPCLTALSRQASLAGAVNTICWHSDGAAVGHNTDIAGFRQSLQDFLADISRPPSLAILLGSGGSALACASVLDEIWPGPVLVAARNETTARHVIDGKKGAYTLLPLQAELLLRKINREPCLLINTLPIGLTTTVPDWLDETLGGLPAGSLLFDLVYSNDRSQSTVLCGRAEHYGVRCVDGLGMLIEQARAAFFLWTGIRVPVPVMSRSVK